MCSIDSCFLWFVCLVFPTKLGQGVGLRRKKGGWKLHSIETKPSLEKNLSFGYVVDQNSF